MLTKILFLLSLFANLLKPQPLPESSLNITTLPIIYFSPGQIALSPSPGVISYAQLEQCNESTAGNPLIYISIIQPENTRFSTKVPFALLEISYCEDSWEADCIIATNYLNNNGIIQGFNNITIPYNDSVSTLYMRLKSVLAETSVALHVSYTDDLPIFAGQFSPFVFNSIVAGSGWGYFYQSAKTDQIESVYNNNNTYFYVNFCQPAIIVQPYTITVTVTASQTTPAAAFDLAVCPKAQLKDFADCNNRNTDQNVALLNSNAISTVSVPVSSSQYTLSEGIFIGVYGFGGERDKINEFTFTVIEAPGA